MGAERADFWLFASSEVNSPLATTIENTEKFRRSDQAENGLSREVGGGDGSDVEPSLVDAALICKEFLSLRHCDRVRTLVRPLRAALKMPLAEMAMRGPGPDL